MTVYHLTDTCHLKGRKSIFALLFKKRARAKFKKRSFLVAVGPNL